ncbi:TetR/AcrR family transcriptional regulator [Nitrospirillum sp. BR 11752]|uniref:TetR family transcriptional regulator n=1 Tax=Nitrospirillum amazonense TaxID=28077 RepID=A0A560HHZ0_9PROT|nr:TetR/AcrR family transcriptional regulator [Nitrospirillum amazonense]MEE3623704.1 TetR/AcrR family transcriptional regulator [Nitrospirillum sp. BR 11752]TWB46077.1 TetR family transcriptional regulator [Nitrospirillum amazonense]
MDNATRSERTRAAVIQAALTVIARDGAGKLTLDAIARESGISKGGVMHQFRTKQAVLEALLDHQVAHSDQRTQAHLTKIDPASGEANLQAQIAVLREVSTDPTSVAYALVGAMAEDPHLLSIIRAAGEPKLQALKDEAQDGNMRDMALLRWVAARGLAIPALMGMCPLTQGERDRLFDLLQDGARWKGCKAAG